MHQNLNLNKKLGKYSIHALVVVLIVANLYIAFIPMITSIESVSWDDNVDDLKCFEFGDFEDMFADPENMDIEDIMSIWEWGDLSATPDCVDITQVSIAVDDDNVTLIIDVQGDPESCLTFLFGFFNCSNGLPFNISIFGISLGSYGDELGGSFGEENGYYMYNNTEEEFGEWDFSNGDFRLVFPSDWFIEGANCTLFLILGAMNPFTLEICGDLFYGDCSDENANNPYEDGNGNGNGGTSDPGSYSGIDPITNTFDTVADVIFGAMCGSLPFIFLIMLLLVVQKILADRKPKVLDYISLVVMGIIIWITTIYLFNINIAGDLFGIDLINLFTLITLLSFLAYSIMSGAHAFDILGNNSWCFTLGFAFQFVIGVIYCLPLYSFECPYPAVSLTIEIIIALLLFIGLKISQKFSHKKGGGKR